MERKEEDERREAVAAGNGAACGASEEAKEAGGSAVVAADAAAPGGEPVGVDAGAGERCPAEACGKGAAPVATARPDGSVEVAADVLEGFVPLAEVEKMYVARSEVERLTEEYYRMGRNDAIAEQWKNAGLVQNDGSLVPLTFLTDDPSAVTGDDSGLSLRRSVWGEV